MDHYQQVEDAWGDKKELASQPVPKDKAIDIALTVYLFMFGKPFIGKVKLTSGRR